MPANIFRDPLSDLSRRFLGRNWQAIIELPPTGDELAPSDEKWEAALCELVNEVGYDPPEMYCLKDNVKAKYNQPYFPEKEADEQSVKNAIRVQVPGRPRPVEISVLLERLKPLTQEPVDRVRYYLPKELQQRAITLRAGWK